MQSFSLLRFSRSVCISRISGPGSGHRSIAQLLPVSSTSTLQFSPRKAVHDILKTALQRAYPELVDEPSFDFSVRADLQLNTPKKIAGRLRLPVDEVAESIIRAIPPNDVIASATNSSGFVNLMLSRTWLSRTVTDLVHSSNDESADSDAQQQQRLQQQPVQRQHGQQHGQQQQQQPPPLIRLRTSRPRNVLVDFASPNMCKELHVGHMRSLLLGDCLARVLEYVGHRVERVSHVGDFGTPLGLVLAQAFEEQAAFLAPGSTELPSPAELSRLYVTAKQRSTTDRGFMADAHRYCLEIQKKELGDPAVYRAWVRVCEASRLGFKAVFDTFGVTMTEQGESFYSDMLRTVVDELRGKRLAVQSEGAQCVFLPRVRSPMVIQKADGAYLYATTDLATLKYRLAHKKDWIIYVTDASQAMHFNHVFQIGRMAGWYDPKKVRLDHVAFGVMKGADNRKLSSRDGAPYPLLELLHKSFEATEAVLQQLKNGGEMDAEALTKATDVATALGKPNQLAGRHHNEGLLTADLNETIALNALRYFDLSHSDAYMFSFARMLTLKGNSGVYLMYAFSRIQTLRDRYFAQTPMSDDVRQALSFASKERSPRIVIETDAEHELAAVLVRFPDVVGDLETTLAPHSLCEYLFLIAQRFHTFYESCRVIGEAEYLSHSRLHLCFATERVLHQGMMLLGLRPVRRM